MPNYSFHCIECQHSTDFNCKYEDRPVQVACENCGKMAPYKLIPPGIMTHSYLDGQKRKGFQDMKEAAKLNKQMANLDHKDRGEIEKEITQKLKVDIRRDTPE